MRPGRNVVLHRPEILSPLRKARVQDDKGLLLKEISPHILTASSEALFEASKNETYRVILSRPVQGDLNIRPDGLFDAFVKGPDGRIAAVARLAPTGPQFIGAAMMLAGHGMLLQISQKIEELQRDIDLLIKLHLADLAGSVNGPRQQLSQIHNYDPEHKNHALLLIDSQLAAAVSQARENVSQLISSILPPTESNFMRIIWGNEGVVIKSLQRAEVATKVLLAGLMALAETHLLLNGRQNSTRIMLSWLKDARLLDFETEELKARMIPIRNANERHDAFWRSAIRHIDHALETVECALDPDETFNLEIEAFGRELCQPV